MRRSCSFATRPSFTALVKRKERERGMRMSCLFCSILLIVIILLHFLHTCIVSFFFVFIRQHLHFHLHPSHIHLHTHSTLYSFVYHVYYLSSVINKQKNPQKQLCIICMYIYSLRRAKYVSTDPLTNQHPLTTIDCSCIQHAVPARTASPQSPPDTPLNRYPRACCKSGYTA